MPKVMIIPKHTLQKNGFISSTKMEYFQLMELDLNNISSRKIVDRFRAVELTKGGYATSKTFKMDFSKYKYDVWTKPNGDEVLLFSEDAYYDLKSKYCKEYKTFIDKEKNNIATRNSAWAKHMTDPYDIG